MALATKCPYCSTVFRVAYDQLKLRGGIVRCGCCQQVFDGNAGLQVPAAAQPLAAPLPFEEPDFPDAVAEAIAPKPVEPFEPAVFEPVFAAPAQQAPGDAPLDLPLPDAAPLPPMRADLDPDFDFDLDFDLDAEAPAESAHASKPAPTHHWIDLDALTAADGAPLQREAKLTEPVAPAPAPAPEALAAEPAAVPAALPAAEAGDSTEPAFVMRGRRNQRHGKTVVILMSIGACALLLALVAQGVMTFGSQLAAHAPSLKPALTTLCNALGCRIALPMQIKSLSIELGELQTLSATTFSYATVLHNNSGSVQAWPNIELMLSDGADKAVLRRVFAPSEYLGQEHKQEQITSEGFAARSEQAVKLYFELAQINASGYHIAVFYP